MKKFLELSFESTERLTASNFIREYVPCFRTSDGRIKTRPDCFRLRKFACGFYFEAYGNFYLAQNLGKKDLKHLGNSPWRNSKIRVAHDIVYKASVLGRSYWECKFIFVNNFWSFLLDCINMVQQRRKCWYPNSVTVSQIWLNQRQIQCT